MQGMIPVVGAINHPLSGQPMPFDATSANSWVILIVYGGWAMFGITFLGATYAY